MAYIDDTHILHSKAQDHVRDVTASSDVYVPSPALLELDLVLKSNQYTFEERKATFRLLESPIPPDKVLKVTPEIMKRVTEFDRLATWTSHYFDSMVAAVAENCGAEVVTTDAKIPLLGVKTSW